MRSPKDMCMKASSARLIIDGLRLRGSFTSSRPSCQSGNPLNRKTTPLPINSPNLGLLKSFATAKTKIARQMILQTMPPIKMMNVSWSIVSLILVVSLAKVVICINACDKNDPPLLRQVNGA